MYVHTEQSVNNTTYSYSVLVLPCPVYDYPPWENCFLLWHSAPKVSQDYQPYSTMSKARIRIPAHVFGYSLAIIPVVYFGYYYQSNKASDADFEEELRKNYSHNIQASQSNRAEMVKVVEALKRGNVSKDKRIDEMLHAGKGDKKRHYPVDEKYYGTEEGIAAKERIQEELKMKQAKKKAAAGDSASTTKAAMSTESGSPRGEDAVVGMSTRTISAIALATVGTAAVAAALLLGGGRSR